MKFKFVPRKIEERTKYREISWWNKLVPKNQENYCLEYLVDINNITEEEIKKIYISAKRPLHIFFIEHDLDENKFWKAKMNEIWGVKRYKKICEERKFRWENFQKCFEARYFNPKYIKE